MKCSTRYWIIRKEKIYDITAKPSIGHRINSEVKNKKTLTISVRNIEIKNEVLNENLYERLKVLDIK
tara:strand:+ start:140819 stop:141019 length:201 start_codon:yes stop_codon:yes gene_type:complete